MIEIKELEWKKRDDLHKGIAQLGVSQEEAKRIFEFLEDECVIEITTPKMEDAALQMILIQASHTGRITGESYKPGNIILNIKNAVVNYVALGASMAASIGAISMSQPVIALFTVLSVVLSAVGLCKNKLDENAVLLLAVLWKNRHMYDQWINADAGLELVDQYLESCQEEKLSVTQYNYLLDDLSKAGCIVLNDGKIKLREKICMKY